MMEMSAQQEALATRHSNYRRSPSPLRIQPFSNAAIAQLAEKVKSEEQFSTTLPVSSQNTIVLFGVMYILLYQTSIQIFY